MKRILLIAAAALTLSSCAKKIDSQPEIVICYLAPSVPIRIVNTLGEDLLSPSKLPGGTIDLDWGIAGTKLNTISKMTPGVYTKAGQPDQYYISMPLVNTDNGMALRFSLKAGTSDSLYIRTAASSSKPFGLTELNFNGNKINPVMLFDNTQFGVLLVKNNGVK